MRSVRQAVGSVAGDKGALRNKGNRMLKRYKQGTLRNGAAETRERMKEMVRTGCRRLRLSVGVCLVCAALQGGTAHAQDYGKPLDMPVLQLSLIHI